MIEIMHTAENLIVHYVLIQFTLEMDSSMKEIRYPELCENNLKENVSGKVIALQFERFMPATKNFSKIPPVRGRTSAIICGNTSIRRMPDAYFSLSLSTSLCTHVSSTI